MSGVYVAVAVWSDASVLESLLRARIPQSVMPEASGPLMSRTDASNSGVWYMKRA